MIPEKKFCKGCGQQLSTSIISKFIGSKSYEFEDGSYCEKCATELVQNKRRQLKNK